MLSTLPLLIDYAIFQCFAYAAFAIAIDASLRHCLLFAPCFHADYRIDIYITPPASYC